MTNQTFTVVGITDFEGNAKVRFTDDMVRRVKQFAKGGSDRVDFIELPHAMTKIEALKFMLTHPTFKSEDDQATIMDTLSDKEKDARKGTVRVVGRPSLASIAARPKLDVTAEDILEATKV